MPNAFIQLALQGRNDSWRYLVGLLITVFSLVLGSTAVLQLFMLYVEFDGNPETIVLEASALSWGQSPVEGISPTLMFVINGLGFLFFFGGIAGVVRGLHGRSLRSLITPEATLNWFRIWQGFSVFFLLYVGQLSWSYVRSPQDFVWIFNLGYFFWFFWVVLLLTPVQVATEELLFRGYLLQGIGSKLGSFAGAVLSSLLFMLLHGLSPALLSQATWSGKAGLFFYYFLVGGFLCWLTLKDRSSELALGVHAANNIATFLLVARSSRALLTPALFSVDQQESNFSLTIFTILSMLLFSVVVFRLWRQPVA